jgi:peptidoglycan/LPS O-acetylase OafA/YrhL
MVRFRPGASSGQSHPRARAQRLDVLIGVLGFFGLMACLQAVTLEVQGRPAGLAALVLLAVVVALFLAVRARRRTGV